MKNNWVRYQHDLSTQYDLEIKEVKPQCPKCQQRDTLTTIQEAYGDRTTCTCGYLSWYGIGD